MTLKWLSAVRLNKYGYLKKSSYKERDDAKVLIHALFVRRSIVNKQVKLTDYDSLQQCIDVNNHAERLEIVVPTGTYLTGPIDLRANLTITLEKGAVLKFKDDPNLYPPVWTRWEGIECYAMHPLIFAQEKNNITIQGEGVIDGAGQAWWDKFEQIKQEDRTTPRYAYEKRLAVLNTGYREQTGGGGRRSTQFLRPPLLQIWKCQHFTLKGVTLRNSPWWTFHMVYSQDIRIENVHFNNPADAINTDAMDIDSSKDVTVTGCLINVGDDGVTLKSGSGPSAQAIGIPTENVRVSHCRILSSMGGIAIGSETAAGVKNLTVNDCVFTGTQRAVRLKTRRGRGGTIQGIHLRNLKMDRCWCPVALQMYFASEVGVDEVKQILSLEPQPVTAQTPHIQDVEIEKIEATNVRCVAAFIVGLPEAKIKNVKIDDFKWQLAAANDLLPLDEAEKTGGTIHVKQRGINTINVSNLYVNGHLFN